MWTVRRMRAAIRTRALKVSGQSNLEIFRMFQSDRETSEQLADERKDKV